MLRSFEMRPSANRLPRVGVPWRRATGEKRWKRRDYDAYLRAIREAGGDPVEISLLLPLDELARLAASLDAVVLPGSGADVEPGRYGSAPHAKAAAPDIKRERTDDFLLEDAFAGGKSVLAICYGAQLLNVHLGGSLVQDIPSELETKIDHAPGKGVAHAFHSVRVESEGLAEMADQVDGSSSVRVNSSHHQAILNPGRELRIAARAPDGVIEAVEWTGGLGWVVGVQWHPERMPGDAFAEALFRRLVSEARASANGR
jgi:putative glutamine amidotransferase